MKQRLFTRDFTLLALGQALSLAGNYALRFALSMYVLELTGSAGVFAGMLALAMAPTVLLSPLGGALADRCDRRRLMAGMDAASGLAVLLALPPDPNRLDIYNDLDAELVNLFSCIKECSNVLLRELKFLPIHSRKLFEYYRDFVAHKEVYFQNVQAEIECLGDRSCFTEEQAGELLPIFQERLALYDVKRAAAYYLAIRGSFSGTINSFGVKGVDVERFLKLFPPVSARLKDVPLENKNALQLIRERDKKGSLIYADPPYVKTERLYRVAGKLGRFRRFHVRLWQVLTGRDSYVVLSYNDCPFIRKLYQDWYISSFQRSNPLSQKKGSSFGELIITNYDPRPYMTSQMNLFDEPLGEWELKLVHIPNHPPRRKTA